MAQLARKHPDPNLSYMTVHRSKGARPITSSCFGTYGFRTEITDDPLLDPVLAAPEGCAHAEQRRLFHVAVTCARRGAFLPADGELLPPASTNRRTTAMTLPCSVGRRRVTLPALDASKDAWRAAKTGGTGACSTVAHTSRSASTGSPPVPIAGPDYRSRPTALSVAATVAGRSRNTLAATGGFEPGRESTGRFRFFELP